MKAWQVSELGEPLDVMKLVEDVPQPAPGPGQLLVRVRAAAVNFPDALMVRGHYQVRPPLPFTPGVELCGEVVSGARRGERLIGNPVLPHGAFAEYALLDAAAAFPAPDALDDAEASALHIGYQTAWFALHRRARLRAGETLLVHAAAGGVGSAAVQLGRAAGARVIAVVGGPAKAEAARALGADVVVDRTAEDFVAVVKQVTDGRGADVVFDPVGGDAFTGSTKCIAFEGRIVVVGFAAGQIPAPALNHALVKNYAILGLHWGLYNTHAPQTVQAAHEELTKLTEAGVVRPLVSARLPLASAAEAVQRVADGRSVGRLVVLGG
ncbi:NADPH:quinone oxidoreductase family protein [Streptomyces sp. SP17BM10]|uniref:NADPH:quinone oxidoreductase family protein n=1 Tax=Streptomyces sp. SP17BM10 TaxID=3002530 RepID=UPI002E75BDFC|nr:NADPH:quinone oxidoreductase family protein [Streptomyces sp. SP17BM10]MEE1786060.1 NADPH:quinone oxidoreductase family protein [Streptomyces sp. SP17BM10]